MKKNVVHTLLAVALPLTFAMGCAHTGQPETAGYDPAMDAALTPTSTRPDSPAYPEDAAPAGIIMRTPAPAGASTADWRLGEELRGALTAEKSLAPYPSEVSVGVAKDSPGLVRLSGAVSSGYERQRLHDRIAQVPGVLQIDDQIVVEVPEHSGEFDPSRPSGEN